MSDYISRQAALDALENIDCSDGVGISALKCDAVDDAVTAIQALPSADVVEVVRCKDCKYYYYADNRIPSERGWACANDGCYASQNDYCSWGERIDG